MKDDFNEAQKEVDDSRFTVAYYLTKIPTEKAVLDSIAKERNFAYFQLGLIYKDKFKEYLISQEKLEKLLKQFPEERLILPTKYNLYKVYSLLGLSILESNMKQNIIENH